LLSFRFFELPLSPFPARGDGAGQLVSIRKPYSPLPLVGGARVGAIEVMNFKACPRIPLTPALSRKSIRPDHGGRGSFWMEIN